MALTPLAHRSTTDRMNAVMSVGPQHQALFVSPIAPNSKGMAQRSPAESMRTPRRVQWDVSEVAERYTTVHHYNEKDINVMDPCNLADDSGYVDEKELMSTPKMPIPETVPQAPCKPRQTLSRRMVHENYVDYQELPCRNWAELFPGCNVASNVKHGDSENELMSTPKIPVPDMVPQAPRRTFNRRIIQEDTMGSPEPPGRSSARQLFPGQTSSDRMHLNEAPYLLDSSEDVSFGDLDNSVIRALVWDSDSGFLDDEYMKRHGEITKSEI